MVFEEWNYPRPGKARALKKNSRGCSNRSAEELKALTEEARKEQEIRGELEGVEPVRGVPPRALEATENLTGSPGIPEAVAAELARAAEAWRARVTALESRWHVLRFQPSKSERDSRNHSSRRRAAPSGISSRRAGAICCSPCSPSPAVFAALKFLHRYIDRFSPWHKPGKKSFYVRLADVCYYLLTFVLSFGAALLVFYVAGDWTLLTLGVVALLAVALAAKDRIPRFYEQARLLLNVGEVREGERVHYGGIPWRVQSLGFLTRLQNPLLDGGELLLPLREIQGLISRDSGASEPWFPCEVGSWIRLGDGTKGKVVNQTPEIVQIVALGGARTSYPTADFLALAPQDFSSGFRLRSTFGIGYRHQAIATTEVAERLWKAVAEAIYHLVDREDVCSLKVEFSEAGASSLDYEIIADLKGACAPIYEPLRRAIQRACVDACNEHGWEIPFQQMTVHFENGGPEERGPST
ncbi:MAG: mechanosensitive ion channel family protein [Verrucomicrobiales bacterium]